MHPSKLQGQPLPLLPGQALALHASTAAPAGSNPLSSPASVGVTASAGSHKQPKRRRGARGGALLAPSSTCRPADILARTLAI